MWRVKSHSPLTSISSPVTGEEKEVSESLPDLCVSDRHTGVATPAVPALWEVEAARLSYIVSSEASLDETDPL